MLSFLNNQAQQRRVRGLDEDHRRGVSRAMCQIIRGLDGVSGVCRAVWCWSKMVRAGLSD
jgi:hypothetical protein